MSISIIIPEEIRNLIQQYDIETKARKEIILLLLQNNDDININDIRFNEYQKNYEEKFYAFEIAKNELENNYIKPILKNNQKLIKWSLNYATCEVIIDINNNE